MGLLRKLFNLIFYFRLLLVILTVVITGFFVYKSTHLKLYDDPNKWPPKNHPSVLLNDYIQNNFGGANVVTIQVMVKNGDIFNIKTLEKIKRIHHKILLIYGVVPYYVVDLAALKVKYMKGTEDFLDIFPLMEDVPKTPEEMERLKYGVYHNPTIYGSLVSPDAKATIIIADFRTGEKLPDVVEEVPRTDPVTIYKEIKSIIDPENDENHTVMCTGSPIIIGWVNSEGLRYIPMALGFFILVMAVILYFSFRNFAGVFIPIAVGLVATVWAFGINSLLTGDVLRSSSAFIAPFIIMAAATCHSVQFLRRFFSEEYPNAKDSNPEEAITNTGLALFAPMLLSLITDMGAFLVLVFVPFENVSVLGAITALGLVCLIICFYLLGIPLLSLFPGKRKVLLTKKEIAKGGGFLENAINKVVATVVKCNRASWAIILSLVAILVLSILTLPRLKPGQDNTYAIHNYLTRSWKSNPIYQAEMQIKERFKGIYPLNILIETKDENGLRDPEVLRKIDEFSSFLRKFPEVAGCTDLPLYVKLMHRFFHDERDEYFKIPEERKPIGEYLYMYAAGMPGAFDSVMDYYRQRTILAAYVDSTSHETVEKILREAKNYARTHFDSQEIVAKIGGGSIAIAGAFNENIIKWLILGTLFAALCSLAVVFLLLKSVVAGIFLLLPLFIGTSIWLMLIYVSGIEINSNVTTSMAIAMGVGIDAEVYFLYRFREEFTKMKGDFKLALVSAFTKIRKALIFSHFALIVACFSLIPIPLYLGYVGYCMGLIILICFITSFIISPFLWSLLKPSFLFANGTRGTTTHKSKEEIKMERR